MAFYHSMKRFQHSTQRKVQGKFLCGFKLFNFGIGCGKCFLHFHMCLEYFGFLKLQNYSCIRI
uniref:Uncharacterized protein n=1 Tax=Rhizophora mucronata TaxID=61149 RepID=A0A2P2NKR2_RHIMU